MKSEIEPAAETISEVEAVVAGTFAILRYLFTLGEKNIVVTVRRYEKGIEIVIRGKKDQIPNPNRAADSLLRPAMSHVPEVIVATRQNGYARTFGSRWEDDWQPASGAIYALGYPAEIPDIKIGWKTKESGRSEMREVQIAVAGALTNFILPDGELIAQIPVPGINPIQPQVLTALQNDRIGLLQGERHAVLPANLLNVSTSVRRAYLETILKSASGSAEGSRLTIHLAGENAGKLKENFYGKDLAGLDPILKSRSGIFKVSLQDETSVAARLHAESRPLAVGLAKSGELSSEIPAFLIDEEAFRKLPAADQLKYLVRVTEFLLTASTLKGTALLKMLQDLNIPPSGGQFIRLRINSILSEKFEAAMASVLAGASA